MLILYKLATLPFCVYNKNNPPHPLNGNNKGLCFPIIVYNKNTKENNMRYVNKKEDFNNIIGFLKSIKLVYKWNYNWIK